MISLFQWTTISLLKGPSAGLNELDQEQIRSARMLLEVCDIFTYQIHVVTGIWPYDANKIRINAQAT